MTQVKIQTAHRDREDLRDFEARTGLPARGTKRDLKEIDEGRMRHFNSDSFELDGRSMRIEQMQYGNENGQYMWKRMVPAMDMSDTIPFQIHLELGKTTRYFPYH